MENGLNGEREEEQRYRGSCTFHAHACPNRFNHLITNNLLALRFFFPFFSLLFLFFPSRNRSPCPLPPPPDPSFPLSSEAPSEIRGCPALSSKFCPSPSFVRLTARHSLCSRGNQRRQLPSITGLLLSVVTHETVSTTIHDFRMHCAISFFRRA